MTDTTFMEVVMKIELSDAVVAKLCDAWMDPDAGVRLEADFEPSGSGPLCGAVAIEMSRDEVALIADRMRPRGEPRVLDAPARHHLADIFRELRFGRPVPSQRLLIALAEITAEDRWSLGAQGELLILPRDQSHPSVSP